jgi:NitT/TauT family transport system permease protein
MLLLLEILVDVRIISPFVLSKPSQIFVRLIEMTFNEGLFKHILLTSFLSILSATIGFLFGLLIAYCMLIFEKIQSFSEFVVDFLRSIPLTTLIPIFIAVYGIGNSPKVAIGAVSAALTSAITIYIGLKSIRKSRSDLLKIYEPNNSTLFTKIYFKDGTSVFYTSIRLCISTALVLIIVSEMFIGTENGVGKLIIDKSYTDDRAGQYAVVFTIGVIGWFLNHLFKIIQSKETIFYGND